MESEFIKDIKNEIDNFSYSISKYYDHVVIGKCFQVGNIHSSTGMCVHVGHRSGANIKLSFALKVIEVGKGFIVEKICYGDYYGEIKTGDQEIVRSYVNNFLLEIIQDLEQVGDKCVN